ncbi:hypothetical protein IWX46DRAFT_463801, partial [Phyllosticta citricarpa]
DIVVRSCVDGKPGQWWWPRRTIRRPTVGQAVKALDFRQGTSATAADREESAVIIMIAVRRSGCTDGVSSLRCVRLLGARLAGPGQQGLSAPPIPIDATTRQTSHRAACFPLSQVDVRGGQAGGRAGAIQAGSVSTLALEDRGWSAGRGAESGEVVEHGGDWWSLLAGRTTCPGHQHPTGKPMQRHRARPGSVVLVSSLLFCVNERARRRGVPKRGRVANAHPLRCQIGPMP